jgi:two-component system response regulator YesN
MLADLLLRLVEHVSLKSEPTTASLESRIVRAEKVAQENLGAAFGVEHFAQAAGMSRSRFSTVYKQLRGTSPGMFLRNERMQRAVELLSVTNRSAADVGVMVGYPDPTAFGRVFRAHTGKTPGQFRRILEFEARDSAA